MTKLGNGLTTNGKAGPPLNYVWSSNSCQYFWAIQYRFLDDVWIFGFIIIYRRLEAEDDTILRHCTTLGK
jgi:hypothetical protein